MAGYHCLMPNGIFPANPSPMSNGIVSLLTAPCMLPNGIFFAIVHPQYYSFFYILLLMCIIYHWCPLKMPKA